MFARVEPLDTEIVSAYGAWGISPAALSARIPMSLETLQELLTMARPSHTIEPTRCIPTTFRADDPRFSALPRPVRSSWPSCERMLRDRSVGNVMVRLPLFWQAGFALYEACSAARVPLFTNDTENLPLGVLALKDAAVDTLVTQAHDVGKFIEHCKKTDTALPRNALIIHELESSWDIPTCDGIDHVRNEVHLFPGVTLLEQCDELGQSTKFHCSDSFIWEFRDAEVFLTEKHNRVFPIVRFHFGRALQRVGMCACGKDVYETSL